MTRVAALVLLVAWAGCSGGKSDSGKAEPQDSARTANTPTKKSRDAGAGAADDASAVASAPDLSDIAPLTQAAFDSKRVPAARTLNSAALKHHRAGHLDQAIAGYKDALRADPGHTIAPASIAPSLSHVPINLLRHIL